MKKLSLLLATVVLTGSMLVACGGSNNNAGNDADANNQGSSNVQTEANTGNDASSNEEAANDGFVFTYKDVDVQINALMEPVVMLLGEPDSYFESESCAFQGLDKVYTYGSVVISTYPLNEVDYVFSIELKDDTVETPEGIYIGSTKDDVKAAYGEPSDETDTAFIYVKGESQLNIMFDGDSVSSIVYISLED